VANPLYGRQANRVLERYERPGNRYNPVGSRTYPFVFTTYRLTEHHTAAGMSRTLGYLSVLQPEMFCEVSPELAELRGLVNGDGANDLLPILGDPNVHIMESKANTCDVLAGRRPRGPALVELVERHRARAARERTDQEGDPHREQLEQ
jgi:formate dehydrogenase major subunit